MITYTYGTIFAFRNVSTFVTDDSSRISFLIHEDSDPFSLRDIFLYSLQRQLRKMRSKLFRHIHQEDRLLSSLDFVNETFVVHTLVCTYWKKRRKPKSEGGIDFLEEIYIRMVFIFRISMGESFDKEFDRHMKKLEKKAQAYHLE